MPSPVAATLRCRATSLSWLMTRGSGIRRREGGDVRRRRCGSIGCGPRGGGWPTPAMWVYRIGAERAKRMLLTGDTIDGATAASWGLVVESVPADALDEAVERLADRIAGVPINQLVMQKLMINQAYDNMGLQGTQLLA